MMRNQQLIQIGKPYSPSAIDIPRNGLLKPGAKPRPKRRDAIRILGQIAACATVEPARPLLAQIVVTRRCNLACGYCFEYDDKSPPVPFETLRQRIHELKRLRTVFVTLNGGEPLLHPQIVEVVAEIRRCGMTPMMNTNGFLLKPRLINELGKAGLYGMQISVDSLKPTAETRKALSLLRPQLEMLAAHAKFTVRVNTVLGAGPPAEALEVSRYAKSLGFDTQCSLMRNARGNVLPLSAEAEKAYLEIRGLDGRLPAYFNDDFQLPLARGEASDWKCRAGARYFHLCEDGLVHLCQPRTGTPAIPLEKYTREHLQHYFDMKKDCSTKCPHAYAHIGSRLDGFRGQPNADEVPS